MVLTSLAIPFCFHTKNRKTRLLHDLKYGFETLLTLGYVNGSDGFSAKNNYCVEGHLTSESTISMDFNPR